MIEISTEDFARTHTFILAGGIGQRLLPLTALRPKPAVPFGRNSRIIDFTLSNCVMSGLVRVSVLTQYRHELLHRYIQDRWTPIWNAEFANRQQLKCIASPAGARYRGTADAVFKTIESVSPQSDLILILSGDHVYRMDYLDLLQQHRVTNADVTIATTRYPQGAASTFGVMQVDEQFNITGFEEKPARPKSIPSDPAMSLVNMGVYVFRKTVLLAALQAMCGSGAGFDFAHDIIPLLMRSARTRAYDFQSRKDGGSPSWRDIGTIDSYYAASMDLIRSDAPLDPYTSDPFFLLPAGRTSPKFEFRNPRVHSTASVRNTMLSSGVQVGPGAVISDSVILPGAHIGRGAQLRRAIVEENLHIPDGFRGGLDLEDDRRQYAVSESGIVVITSQPVTALSTKREGKHPHSGIEEFNLESPVFDSPLLTDELIKTRL